jgi:ribosomal protein S18 acetylase RimI-like enzyme
MAEPRRPRHLRSVPTGARAARHAPGDSRRPAARDAPAVLIRAARGDEADAVADVYLASRRHAGAFIPRGRYTDDDVRLWFASVVLVTRETWVAEAHGRIAALLVLRGDSLDQLYVHPRYQRRGIGSALLAHARRRRRRIRLYTFESNEPARAFYEKHGFRAIAFGDGTANDEGAPDILYEWTAR